jgi:hypothetical protein
MQDLYPLVVRLPATADLTNVSLTFHSVDLQLNSAGGNASLQQGSSGGAAVAASASASVLWWTVSINTTDPFRESNNATGLIFNTVSDR